MNNQIEPSVKQKQLRRVLGYMRIHGSITQADADTISVRRLASRIDDLKRMGFVIGGKMCNGVNQYGEKCKFKRYWLEENV
jgi:hypothetical protein